ncbi:MAG: M48 family metallopeptidase [Bacteroidota bacterium]
MKKIVLRGSLIVVLFISAWQALSLIHWIRVLGIERFQQESLEQLSDLFWNTLSGTQQEVDDPVVTAPIDSILDKICTANGLDRSIVKAHLVLSEEVNACALPGGHLVVFSALIKDCKSANELAGVLAHEVGHIEKGHVTKKLIREFGTSVLVSVSSGKADLPMIKEMLGSLTGSAYDRAFEREADLTAVTYLNTSGIDPAGFADFMDRVSKEEPSTFSWMASHPDAKERAAYIRAKRSENSSLYVDVISDSVWTAWRSTVDSLSFQEK